MAAGNRFCPVQLSPDYGARCWGVEDLAITRDNLVREWRKKGPGRVDSRGIPKPKTGLIWRGTEDEATRLCLILNKAAKLGTMTVASDPPTRENSVANAKIRNAHAKKATRNAALTQKAVSFVQCAVCLRTHKEGKCKK